MSDSYHDAAEDRLLNRTPSRPAKIPDPDGFRQSPMGAMSESAVPEDKNAPCNICGRGWPYHYDACAYKQTANEVKRYRAALEQIAAVPEWWQGKIAQKALSRS